MRWYLNLDNDGQLQLDLNASATNPLSAVSRRRGERPTLEIGAISNTLPGQTLDLGSGVTPDVHLYVNTKGAPQSYDTGNVFKVLAFPKVTGLDGQIVYRAVLPIGGTQIDNDLGVGDPTDVASVTYSAQVDLLYLGGRVISRSVDFTVENNYNRDLTDPLPIADSRVRYVTTPLVSGQNYLDVLFGTPMPDGNWILRDHHVENTVDSPPALIWPTTITSRTANGYRVYFNAAPATGNYSLVTTADQS